MAIKIKARLKPLAELDEEARVAVSRGMLSLSVVYNVGKCGDDFPTCKTLSCAGLDSWHLDESNLVVIEPRVLLPSFL